MVSSFFLTLCLVLKNLQKNLKNYHFHYCLTINILR